MHKVNFLIEAWIRSMNIFKNIFVLSMSILLLLKKSMNKKSIISYNNK